MVKKDSLLILPTLNEEEAIPKIASEIPDGLDTIVVDSFSTDNTLICCRKAGLKCMDAGYGRGQGSGLLTGLEYMLDHDYDYVALIDSDNTDSPKEVPKVLEKLEEGYDVVLGIRDFRKQMRILGATTVLTKKIVSLSILLLTGLSIRDVNTGFWVLNKKAVERLVPRLKERDFAWGFEYMYNIWLLGLCVGEQDVDFRRRLGKTKLTLAKRAALVGYGLEYALKIVYARLVRFLKRDRSYIPRV